MKASVLLPQVGGVPHLPGVPHLHVNRPLLREESAWVWGPAQQEAFQQLKPDMASEQVLALYDAEKETMVSSDASSFGRSAGLMQKQPSGKMRRVAYASRSMTETERRYAQIDKESLAIIRALEQWAEFLIGMRVQVQKDHKSLSAHRTLQDETCDI